KYRRNGPMPEGARLTGTKRLADRYLTEANWGVVERLEEFCRLHGRTLLELAFSWLVSRPTVTSVIAGATRSEQGDANVRAVEWNLSHEDVAEIDRLTRARDQGS